MNFLFDNLTGILVGFALGGGVALVLNWRRNTTNRKLAQRIKDLEASVQYFSGPDYRKKEIGGFLFDTFSRLGSGIGVREVLLAASAANESDSHEEEPTSENQE